MKTIKLLFAACAALFVSQGAFAAKEAKAVLLNSGTTLKFVYDEKNYGTKDTNWFSVTEAENQEQTLDTNKPWYEASSSVTRVVFDDSFAAYKPKNCYQWFYYFDKLTRIDGIENLDVSSATNLGFMFGFCKVLQTIDISQFNTAAAKSIMGMFNGCVKLNTIYASDLFSTSGLTDKNEQVFGGCSTNLKGGNGTVWSSTNVNADFARYDAVDNAGYFTLKKPTVVWNSADTSLTFYFKPAKELPSGSTYTRFYLPANGVTPGWISDMKVYGEPTKVTIDASFADCRPSTCYMWFYNMSGVTDIKGLYNLNVSKVTDSYGLRMMFYGCSKVTKLDLSSFDTANVPSFQGMFEGCSALTTIYATEKFVVKSTASSTDMFRSCSTGLRGGNGTTWSSDKATNKTFAKIDKAGQSGYFAAAPIAVSAVKTLTFYADGADHSGSGLTIYSVAAAETGDPLWKDLGSTVTKAVFDSSFKGYRPTSCASWFEGFEEMTAVEGLDNVNTSEATSFSFMFYDCSKLTSLNLESFDTAKVKDTSNMFNGCSKLATITVSDGFVMTQVTSSPNMFANCNALKGGNGTVYVSTKTDKTYARIDTAATPGYFTAKVALAVWNSSWKTLMFYYDEPKKIPTYDGQFSVADAEKIDLTKDEVPWYSTCAGSATKVVFDASFAAYRPKKCVKWFAKFEKLAYISGMTNLNVSDAVDLTSMFYGCGELRVLDLSNFTTSKVTSMISMFAECSALESIYATEYFTTVKLDPSFGGYGMFHGCTSIRGENGTTYDSSKTAQAYAHIDEAGNKGYFSMPPTVVLSSDGKTLTFYADGAAHAGKATYSVGAALMNEPDVAMPWITDAKGSVTTVAFDSSFRKCRPVHCGGWFYGFTKLTNVKSAKNLTLSSATHLGSMFAYCSALESLYVFAWDTSKVENMKQMFNGCTKLKKVVVSADGFSTASVTESSSMFHGCSALTGGYGTVYDSGKTDAAYARGDTKTQKGYFTYPAVARYNLKTLTFYCDGQDHSGSVGIVYDVNDSAYDVEQDWSSHKGEATGVVFDASFVNYRPASCYGWFSDFSALATVSGLENLDVSRCEYLTSLFEGCSALTTLDLTTFDTAKVQEFDGLFLDCTNLKTILASDKFSLASKTSAADMFDGCDALVGGNGTAYATAKVVDASYAHVDAVDNPGYFTGVLAPVAVYDDAAKTLTFYYDNLGHSGTGKEVFSVQEASDSDPTSPVVPWSGKTDVTKVVFDKSFAAFQPKHCVLWFNNFSAVTEFVGLENLDVSKATRLSSLFKNCSSVTTLDLSTWNTANVTHMTGMFFSCSALTAIYASPAFSTTKVTTTAGKTGTFTGCTKLPNFDPANVTAGQAYIGAGGYLSEKPGVDTARAIYDAAAKTLTFVYDKSHHYGEKTYLVADAEKIDPSSEDVPWYADCHETVTKVVFDTAFAGYRPTKLACWFKYFTALTEIEGLENLDTSAATSMKMMFSCCEALTALDLSGFNTATVTDMSYLFRECKALTALDVSSFVTDKVTDMTWMFKDCKKLTTIYAGAGFTVAGADGTSMFHGCSALVGGAGTTYAGQPSAIQQGKEYARIDNLPGAPGFFSEKGKKKAACVVYADATKTLTFYYDSVDHSSEGAVYEVPSTAKAPGWCTDGTAAKVEKTIFDVSFADFRPTACYSWFDGAKNMATIEGLENLDTSEVVRMDYMFLSCAKLVSLDLTALNVAKVTSMEGMFANCTAMTTLDIQSWNTPKVEKMARMFRNCPVLKRIYAYDTFETTAVTDGGADMFFGCESILGGAGTTYDYPNVGVAYAQVDGQGGKPGYFTKYDPLAVTFDANGGALEDPSESPKMVAVDNKVGLLPIATREGFVFSGWFTEKTGGTKVTDETVIEMPVTFYAQWAEAPAGMCVVTFDPVDGTVAEPYRFVKNGEKIGELPVASSETFGFKGWFTAKSGGTKVEATTVITKDVTYYAQWTSGLTVIEIAIPKADTTLVYTGSEQSGFKNVDSRLFHTGDVTATGAGSYGATFTLPADTKTESYQWVGGGKSGFAALWSIAPRNVADSGVAFAAIPDQTHTGAAIKPSVTMTFAGQVKTSGTDFTVAYSDNVNVGTATATVTGIGNFTGTKALTFKIVDSPEPPPGPEPEMVTVTFDANGGTVSETSRVVEKGSILSSLPTASATGKIFLGWFNAKDGGVQVTEGSSVLGDITLFAHWDEPAVDEYIVIFNGNGGTASAYYRFVKQNAAVGTLPTAEREGFNFVGWFTEVTGGDEVTASTAVTGLSVYHAHWTTKSGTKISLDDGRVAFAAIPNQVYAGGAAEPEVEMTFNGSLCAEGGDYELEYVNNDWVGVATVTVTGVGNFSGSKTLTFNILPATAVVGEYLALDLENDLGVEIDANYKAGDKVTVKVEGLPKGLKVAKDDSKGGAWMMTGVPTEAIDVSTQTMFARVAITYKDKTKGVNGKGETLQPLPLEIIPAPTRTLAGGVLSAVYGPIDIATLWPEAADAKKNPKDWSFKTWPAGLKYNATAKEVAWSYKDAGGAQVKVYAAPYTLYGIPTKMGEFTIVATHKYKLADGKTTVSETASAVLYVWGSATEKTIRYTDKAYVATAKKKLDATVTGVSGQPTGIAFDKGTGILSGTPTKPGVYTTTLTKADKSKEMFLWKVTEGVNDGILDKIAWPEEDAIVTIMQGVAQNWNVDMPAGAKVTATPLPSGIKLAQEKTSGKWLLSGTPTKSGNNVVVFKTVLNGVTVTERVAIIVLPNEVAGTYYLSQDSFGDYGEYTKSSVSASLSIAAGGTAKLILTENTRKTTVSAKFLEEVDGVTQVSFVLPMDAKAGVSERMCLADLNNGRLWIGNSDEQMYVGSLKMAIVPEGMEEDMVVPVSIGYLDVDGGKVFESYLYLTATVNKKTGVVGVAGKLSDGTAIKATTYCLDNETALMAPILVTDKKKCTLSITLASAKNWGAYVRMNGVMNNEVATAAAYGYASGLKNKKISNLMPDARYLVLKSDAYDLSAVIELTAKQLDTKLGTGGLVKLTQKDDDAWAWSVEMVPVFNAEGETYFSGFATGKKGAETRVVSGTLIPQLK